MHESNGWNDDFDHENGAPYDDTTDESCPRCGDQDGSCLCFVVFTWEGEWMYSSSGDIERSSLDRVLQWGHALSLAGGPPSRTCDILAGLPESLAADIESYWVDVAAKVDPQELDEYRTAFRLESRKAADRRPVDRDDPRLGLDPADPRHPMQESYLAKLPEWFEESVLQDSDIRMKRIGVHRTWASICATETSEGRHRTDGIGCSSIWESLCSPDPCDTWNRMEAMMKPVLEKLEGSAPTT